jgi:uncharacterized protein DUF3800
MSDGVASAWIYYVDESYDAEKFCLTALGFKVGTWRAAFEAVKQYRIGLKQSDGVLLRTEIHARELTRGRGSLGPQVIGKWRHSRIFYELLQLTAALPDVHLFNVCLDRSGRADAQLDAWDRLLNRLNRLAEARNRQENALRRQLLAEAKQGMKPARYDLLERRVVPYSAHALLIADQGHEQEIVRLRRKLSVFNMIPSKFGSWGSGAVKNIPLTHLVEDALFRDSAHSYFIQLADCVAFALLKRETTPTAQVRKYQLNKAFDAHLVGICITQASSGDPLGIVRK